MPSLSDLAHRRAALADEDVEWLHLLLADWQLLADLSFADLVLWLPIEQGRGGFVAAAQMRPTTGPTVHHDDIVGMEVGRGRRPQIDSAFDETRICRERDPDWPGDVPVREETIPVVRGGRVIAVVSRHTDLAAARTPSRLELTYLRTADDLSLMMAHGHFPLPGADDQPEGAPRVGDGLIRLDDHGTVTFASPNALSAYRRLGLTADLAGTHLGDLTAGLVQRPGLVDGALSTSLGGSTARHTEIEAGGTTVRLRVIPLIAEGVRTAALVLCRDVTEVRRRERELIGKDVTIREIHHRVKNNLQTVAALLRLQVRRLDDSDRTARSALMEAERRIGSIALVHETLSHALAGDVDFDEVADRVAALVNVSGICGTRVVREGSFGTLVPEVATPLALVLVELVQNAAEHGLRESGGRVLVDVERDSGRLSVTVSDDGPGPATGFDLETGSGLGLRIVGTLVRTELGGRISLIPPAPALPGSGRAADGGVCVQVTIPLPGAPGRMG